MLALGKAKDKGSFPKEEEPESKADVGADYKQVAKDAAKDGDWDAMVDALCSYFESE